MRVRSQRAFVIVAITFLVLPGVGLAGDTGDLCIFPPCCPHPCTVVSSGGPCGLVGIPCDLTFWLSGFLCSGPSDWSEEFPLPPGLYFSGGQGTVYAHVSGVPTTPGTYTFDVNATHGCVFHLEVTITIAPLGPHPMAVDANRVTGSSSNTNGLLEPGETVQVDPFWENDSTVPRTFAGIASNLTGPPGPTYTINDESAAYGTLDAGVTGDCSGATGNCYVMTVSGARPAAHWDASFTELLSLDSISKTWVLHIGASFSDVPSSDPSYSFVENLFHNGVTGGCGGGAYCPSTPVTRGQMAVFILKGQNGGTFAPPACGGTLFTDEPCPGGPFVDWVNALASEGVTGGCGGDNYCPYAPVLRGQMAVFLLKGEHGALYIPPACTATMFADEPCPGGPFVDWVNTLASEGITSGCGSGNYCPYQPVTRGEMAVFLVKTFGLRLYGP